MDGYRFIINCAGLLCDKIAAMVGANNFQINPRKGEYILLSKSQGHLANHVLFPVPSDKGKGILVSQTYHRNILLGPTARDTEPLPGQSRITTNKDVLEYIVHTARGMVDGIDLGETINSFAGLRARSDRGDFIIEMSGIKGFINVAGIDSPGLTSSPAIAEYVLDILRDNGLELRQSPTFIPGRRPIIVPKPQNFDGAVDHSEAELNIICRCEKVTEAEIVDCIAYRPIKAVTLDAIRKRTRAGMGQCQGRFCGERVARLIARETDIPLAMVERRAAGSSLLPAEKDETAALLSKL